MPMSDNERVLAAYDIIIKNLKNNIKSVNDRSIGILTEMETLSEQLVQLSDASKDPLVAQKFREMFNDPDVLYYYQLFQALRGVPKPKRSSMQVEPKK